MSGRNLLGSITFKTFAYLICAVLAVMSIFPFVVMLFNATRNSVEIQLQAIPLLPSRHLGSNIEVMTKSEAFNAITGFRNSIIVSGGTVILAVYFSSLTAYALTGYDWKLRNAVFTFILAVMMIPTQIINIGYYTMVYRAGFTNNYLPLILPAIASPGIVFFMRQYLIATFSPDIVNSARIDGAGEFRIFNQIILPIMKPAIATQAIFVFVASWNALFLPMILLTNRNMYTMPLMVSLLRGNIYNTEYGAIYLGVAMTVLPLFILYFSLSRYIIAGVQLGGVKE